MVNFRWHKSSLDDSLGTSVTVNSFDELYLLINVALSKLGIDVKKEDIKIKYYGYEQRLSEETYLVTLENYGVLGMTNGTFENEHINLEVDEKTKPKNMIIIPFDFHSNEKLLSYMEVKNSMEKGEPIIYTHCLDFFSFSSLNKGYDVKVVKRNGDYILLSELLLNNKDYTLKEIRPAHHVHKMLLANTFTFKSQPKVKIIKKIRSIPKMSKEVQLIKTAIDHLLGAELLSENGWSEEDVKILEDLLESEFEIVKK